MKFNVEDSWDMFQRILESDASVRDSWNKILDFHQDVQSKNYWEELRLLNVEQEQVFLKEWIESLVNKEQIDERVISIWIGINKFLDESGNEVYAMYLTGSDSYERENVEWAVNPIYLPEDRYFVSEIMNQVDNKIKDDKEDYATLDWILPLAYVSFAINDLIRTKLDTADFLKHRSKIFVTAGFDDGDFISLRTIGD